MDYQVVCAVENGKIICRVICAKEIDTETEFSCCLYHNDNPCQARSYSRDTSFSFSPRETGYYYARLFVKNRGENSGEYQDSNMITLIKSDLSPKWSRESVENLWTFDAEQLPFYHQQKPYADFCLIYGYQPDGLAAWGEKEGLYYHAFSRFPRQRNIPCVMLASQPMARTPTCDLFFSGIGRADSMLMLGQDDVEELPDPRVLRDTVGQFTMVYHDSEKIYIGCDYFGIGKLYYYRPEWENRVVISNRYHLLIMTLKYMGIPLSINQDKWIADLYQIGQYAQQIFSRDMEIQDTFLLPVNRCFEIGVRSAPERERERERDGAAAQSGCAEIPSEIDAVLRNPGELDMDEYPKLLRQAADEIIDNIRVIYQSPHIKRVLIDVTGGLDTRIVLSAWTNLNKKEFGNISSYSHTGLWVRNPLDREIGIEIGHMAGIPLKSHPVKRTLKELEHECLKALSCYYGSCCFRPDDSSRQVDGMIRLTGYFGEICCRLYYAREKIFRGGGEYASMEQLIKRLSKPGVRNNRIEDPVLIEAWSREFERELNLMPGFSNCERLDLHYLFNRNRIFFSKEFAPEESNLIWGPIMSKTAFRLKMMSFHIFPELKLQIDLIELLNPKIGNVQYERKLDEEARNQLHTTGQALSERWKPDINETETPLDFSQICDEYSKDLQSNVRTVNAQNRAFYAEKNAAFEERLITLFQRALALVMDAAGEKLPETTREAVYQWVNEYILSDCPIQQKQYFINKILYLYYLRNMLLQ